MQDGWFSEEAAHRLLARAVELDARNLSDVSLTQLREVAREAGISDEALTQAIAELRSGTLDALHAPVESRHSMADVRRIIAGRMARHRGYAVVVIAILVAVITPGDVVMENLLYGLPLYALYSVITRLVAPRDRGRGQPGGPRESAADPALPQPRDVRADVMPSLRLRPA